MNADRNWQRASGFLLMMATMAACCGCLPDGLLITPVTRHRELTEETLFSEAMFTQGKIAVIDVEGIILNANGGGVLFPREHPVAYLLEQLDIARRDSRVKAVVLRINSPGGSVTASELMHYEIRRFRETGKPVVAMMTDVAASGGYYIACACDEIIACRSTVTGSIGVIMQTFDATGTMQKVGLKADAIKSGDQKGAGSPFESMTPEQRAVFQGMIDEFYDQFVDVVEAGRPKLNREQVVELADGRVFTGPQAVEMGLVDRLGSMNDALARAKQLGGIRSAKVVSYARPWGHVPNYYARHAAPASAGTDINLLRLDLGRSTTTEWPPFMYLWQY